MRNFEPARATEAHQLPLLLAIAGQDVQVAITLPLTLLAILNMHSEHDNSLTLATPGLRPDHTIPELRILLPRLHLWRAHCANDRHAIVPSNSLDLVEQWCHALRLVQLAPDPEVQTFHENQLGPILLDVLFQDGVNRQVLFVLTQRNEWERRILDPHPVPRSSQRQFITIVHE